LFFIVFNLKLRLTGASSIDQDEFEALGDLSSDTGSSDDTRSESEEEDSAANDKRASFLKKEIDAKSEKECAQVTIKKSAKLAFSIPQDQKVFTIWRCLCDDEWQKGGALGAVDALRKAIKNPKWTILLCSGGRFAAAVFDGNRCLCHKAMHRYTVRKKQGGTQSTRDASGNAPKSGGASLRRYNETRLREDIEAILQEWKEHINSSQFIFYFAPKGAPRSMLIFEGSPLQAKDPRLKKIPFAIKRPTFLETKIVQQTLSTAEFFKQSDQPPTTNTISETASATTNANSTTNTSIENNSLTGHELHEQMEDLNIDNPAEQNPTKNKKKKKSKTSLPHPQTEANSEHQPRQEDPIYALIRQENLEEIKKLLADKNYTFAVADDVMTPLYAACTTKNIEIIQYFLSSEITKAEINIAIPSQNFFTALHLAASQGQTEAVRLLLDAGADPTIKDITSKVPYDVAKDKEIRMIMRKFAGRNIDLWDYTLAHIDPLTRADEKKKLEKNREKMKQKKHTQKQKKEQEKEEQKEREAAEKQKLAEEEAAKIAKVVAKEHDAKMKNMSDREKRALAAEKRLMASKGVILKCEQCKNEIAGVPFERLEFKYCTTKCVLEHKKIIGR